MRKSPLEDSVQFLKGIGPHRAESLQRIGIKTVEDVLFHFPRDYQNRTNLKPIHTLQEGEHATITGAIVEVRERRPRRSSVRHIYEALVRDHTGMVRVTWFNQPHLTRMLLPGDAITCHGRVKRFGYEVQLQSPEFEKIHKGELESTEPIAAIYPLTEGVAQYSLRKCAAVALGQYLPALPELIPEDIRKRRGLYTRKEAVRILHRPPVENTDHSIARARKTIVFEEFFLLELALGLRKGVRRRVLQERPESRVIRPGLRERFLANLPFPLTEAQSRAIAEIGKDLDGPHAMERLLQGDVGCGKTIVILWSLLWAVERGLQGVLMAPTEILAEQHLRTIERFTQGLDLCVGLHVGGSGSASDESTLWDERGRRPDVVVGTHALFYERAKFDDLGVVAIDEQHKFGVLQRQKLLAKGNHPHLLITSATPIPRTLAMTVYGDLDVSIIDELPPGRPTIVTRWTHWASSEKVFDFLRQHLRAGRQLYIVCPLVEASEKIPHLAAAEDRFPVYRDVIFSGIPCGLIHGRMKAEEKESVMGAFERGDIRVLVSTTVIEVGIDVPNASLMLIENAERFGLSQLHQLRGRIGRGEKKSYCVLMTHKGLNETAERRMQVMESTRDGFRVAEEDLGMRGPGELLGTRQSGALPFRLANLITDEKTLIEAREEALQLSLEHPQLKGPAFEALRKELKTVKYLTA